LFPPPKEYGRRRPLLDLVPLQVSDFGQSYLLRLTTSMVPYGAIDLIYGFPTLESGHGFTNAQALMNIIEAILNLEYLYLRHTSPRTIRNAQTQVAKSRPAYHPQAPLVGFAASIMTAAKTLLYFLQGEQSSDTCPVQS
jgi:hypothetical protein